MSRPRPTELILWNRFWKGFVQVSSGCLEWVNAINPETGYGVMRWDGKTRTTHTIAWEFWHGTIPEGVNVLHKCDNRPCAHPDHLFVGTLLDNNRDMFEKGRQKKETFLTFNGETLHLAEWARRTGLRASTISARIKSGWSAEKALTLPVSRENHSIYLVKT